MSHPEMDLLPPNLLETRTIIFACLFLVFFTIETIRPFYTYFCNSFKAKGEHALRNLFIGIMNAVLVNVIFVGLWLYAASWAAVNHFGLLNWLKSASGMPLWVHTFGALVLLDGWMYVWHRINHKIPFLWRFHRLHHSDPVMDVTTASRFHIGEIFLSSVLRIPLIPLLGVYLQELALYEVLMFSVVQFHHSNINLPRGIDRIFRLVIVSPDMHKVHHSRRQDETDTNYSSLFSVWDRIFGTFRLNPNPESIRLGLEGFDRDEDQTVKGMIRTPAGRQKRTAPIPK